MTSSPQNSFHAGATADLHVDEVHRRIADLVARGCKDLPTERVALGDALGRILAQDVLSPVSVPPHDNAAMDGYAFAGAALDAGTGEVTLHVVGHARAGAPWTGRLGAGEALRIMTGAVMPTGADTVVPQELCRTEADRVRFDRRAVAAGAHRREAGEDLRAGGLALAAGTPLNAPALGLLASLGQAHVAVRRRLRVAIVSTGDELLQPGEPARPGAIYDSNRATLSALVRGLGCDVVDLGPVPDSAQTLADVLAAASRQADAVISSGGVSVGEADHTRAALADAGELAFWHVAMRPGRPFAAGVLANDSSAPSLFFGLPGNPVAAVVSFLLFVRPALLQLAGRSADLAPMPPLVRARTSHALRKRAGRTEYQRAMLRQVPGALPVVDVAPSQSSAVLSAMVGANALIVFPHDQASVQAGDEVDVLLLDGLL
ncbi:gephyrin-like molybdotransferase Glp [Pseudacidovorax sp. RU35E]|uniref:molybdopterin molybdotransferase MoeA n=1 Tax=Pseudacidovorax sp. RU35E TaxID=1907403 RepID=UPI0009564E6C|nr:gephyrin-like molybdotransferase Glp [Pseudacidovorax sp. RU35E]SIQ15610.1 molybdopterin molybdotransferase [Pseudacidovorax sp. RU35E]